jgi:hypothetical protein
MAILVHGLPDSIDAADRYLLENFWKISGDVLMSGD